jgi:hypothetical protein
MVRCKEENKRIGTKKQKKNECRKERKRENQKEGNKNKCKS